MTNYCTNLCPNPSFELGLEGYTELPATEIEQTFTDAASGRASMLVTTTGVAAGEGFYGPMVAFFTDPTGSVSVALSGPSGTLQVSAVINPGGVVLQSTLVDLTDQWQTVQLDGLNIASDTLLYILVQTITPQVLTFKADCIQYEPESPGHAYIDGSLPGCYWTGAPNASSSYQPVAYAVNLVSGMQAGGSLVAETPGGTVDIENVPSGGITAGGSIGVEVTEPAGAFDDFALFELTDNDPAMTYAGWNNATTLSAKTWPYSRNWGVFYPPLDYPVSDGTNAWNRAAYMSMGFEYVNVLATAAQNATLMQAEMLPIVGTNGLDGLPQPQTPAQALPAPSPYDTPRSVHLIVKPTRLNYCPNPSFESGLSSWAPTTSTMAVPTQDPTQYCPLSIAGPVGSFSMNVVSSTAADGVSITVPDLFVGETYTASIYVLPGTGTADIVLTAGQYAGGVPGAALDALINGNPVPPDLIQGQWVRAQVTFVAATSTMTLTLTPMLSTTNVSASFPLTWNADCCLIEEGENAGTYFDGNFGSPDWQWETESSLTSYTVTTSNTDEWTFQGGLGTWTNEWSTYKGNCAVGLCSTRGYGTSPNSMELESTVAGNMWAVSNGWYDNAQVIPVGCTVIPVSAWFQAYGTSRSCYVGVNFFKADGTWLSPTRFGASVKDPVAGPGSASWAQATASIVVPALAQWAVMQVQVYGCGNGEHHYVGDARMTTPTSQTVSSGGVTYETNTSRSYYYENYAVNQEVIEDILVNHVPVGTTPAIPVYNSPPSQ
jgi:hypothetical protein